MNTTLSCDWCGEDGHDDRAHSDAPRYFPHTLGLD